jgi:hypothetical protein
MATSSSKDAAPSSASGMTESVTGPDIAVPSGEQVMAGETISIGGIQVTDAFAATTPGTLALNVSDMGGALTMLGPDGSPLAGSGTQAISFIGTLLQVDAALASLSYANSGSSDRPQRRASDQPSNIGCSGRDRWPVVE